jgi:hypothetical protein
MPDLVGKFRELDAMQFSFASVVEQAKFDLRGMGRKQREIDAQPVPGRAEREGQSFCDMRSSGRDGHV